MKKKRGFHQIVPNTITKFYDTKQDDEVIPLLNQYNELLSRAWQLKSDEKVLIEKIIALSPEPNKELKSLLEKVTQKEKAYRSYYVTMTQLI